MNRQDGKKAFNRSEQKSNKGISADISKSGTENQNQNHNTKKTALGPNTKR